MVAPIPLLRKKKEEKNYEKKKEKKSEERNKNKISRLVRFPSSVGIFPLMSVIPKSLEKKPSQKKKKKKKKAEENKFLQPGQIVE